MVHLPRTRRVVMCVRSYGILFNCRRCRRFHFPSYEYLYTIVAAVTSVNTHLYLLYGCCFFLFFSVPPQATRLYVSTVRIQYTPRSYRYYTVCMSIPIYMNSLRECV